MANLADILEDIRTDLADFMETAGYGSTVYLVEAKIDEIVGQYALQIVPTGDTAVHPNSGVGLIRSGVEIVVWWRGLFDSVERGDQRIAGTAGVTRFVTLLREHLTQRKFAGMKIAMIFRSGGTLEPQDGLDGWLTLRDSYDFAYEITWTPSEG